MKKETFAIMRIRYALPKGKKITGHLVNREAEVVRRRLSTLGMTTVFIDQVVIVKYGKYGAERCLAARNGSGRAFKVVGPTQRS